MSTLKIPKLADELFLRPIVISMNSLALSALMSYVMSANAGIDWRPITICVTSDILTMGADHLKDKEKEFSSDRNNANDPRLASWFLYARTFLNASAVLLASALSQCPISTLLTTATFVAPALLWTTPISFKMFWLISRRLLGGFGRYKHQPSTSAPILVIKRIPGMKAILMVSFEGTLHICLEQCTRNFRCSIYAVVFSVLSGSGSLTNTLPSPWSAVQLTFTSQIYAFSSCNQTFPKFADCKIHEAMHSPADAYFGILGRQNLLGVNRRQQIPTLLHRRTAG
ncbi:hypothetical protein C8R48DRAFT_675872 [Suillus tomentosus]|nr:hypothetical protein C8R48DRAFT_675872 [Suillus tomentosus]